MSIASSYMQALLRMSSVSRAVSAGTTAGKGDVGGVILADAAAAVAVLIPDDATAGWNGVDTILVAQLGVGAVSFNPAAGVTISKATTITDPVQNSVAGVMRVGANKWIRI